MQRSYAECWDLATPQLHQVQPGFGEGSDKIHLSVVGCDGTEDNLADCAHLGFGVHNCQHGEDAGVTCLLGGTIRNYSFCLLHPSVIIIIFRFCIALNTSTMSLNALQMY